MAVPESERSEGKFNIIIEARSLVIYTIQICANDKVFNPKYQRALIDDIINTSKEIFMYLYEANEINVKTRAEERLYLQEQAIRKCNNLLALIQIAKPLFHLRSKRISFWSKKTLNLRESIKTWYKIDYSYCKK